MLKLASTTQRNFSFLSLSNIVSKGFDLKTAPNIECIFNCFMFPRDWEKPSFYENHFHRYLFDIFNIYSTAISVSGLRFTDKAVNNFDF